MERPDILPDFCHFCLNEQFVVPFSHDQWLCCLTTKSCPTLCNPVAGLLCPWDFRGGSTGVSSLGSSRPSDWIHICFSCIASWVLYHWATWKDRLTTRQLCGALQFLILLAFIIFEMRKLIFGLLWKQIS